MEQKSFKPATANSKFWGQKKEFSGQNKSEKNMAGNFKAKMIFINDQIKAPNIMIIDDDKNNLWTFPRRIALEMAAEKWLDLVQLVYDPEKMLSTVRLTDYGKYMYQKGKEDKERRKAQKWKDTKELKISYAIGDNDLQLKIKKAQEILQWWDNVKFSIRLKWRERMYEDKAVQKLKIIQEALQSYGKYMYQKGKEDKERRKAQKWKDTKELKISYAIGDNDLQLKIKKAQEILQWWDNVKFSIRLKWRERMYEDKAVQKLKIIQEALQSYGKSQYDTPKKEANGYSIILFSK